MKSRFIPPLLALFLASRSAPALFRGDEDQPRDYRLSGEYFQDVAAIRPPADEARAFEQAYSGFRVTTGSVTAKDLYLEQGLKVPVREDDGDGKPAFLGGLEYREGQDFNGSFRHFTMRGGPAFGEAWSAQLVALLDPRKEYADAAASLRREDGRAQFETRLTLPNFVYEGKNPGGAVFTQRPFNLLVRWQDEYAGGVVPWLRSESDFRSETRYPEEDDHRFDFQSYSNAAGLDLPLGGAWCLYSKVEQTSTRKEVLWLSPEGYRETLDHQAGTVEAISGPRAPGRVRFGYEYDHLYEARAQLTPEGRSAKINRDDHILYGYRTFPFWRRLLLDVGLSLKLGDLSEIPLGQPEYERQDNGMKAKGVLEWVYQGERLMFDLSPTLDLDEMKFGGGVCRIAWSF
ncbi:MAG: hypothetical protein U1F87_04820 [Kiritimatiellia bacterium]